MMDGACTKTLAPLEKRCTHLVTAKYACHGLDLMLEKLVAKVVKKLKRNKSGHLV